MARGSGAVSRCGEDGEFVVRPASFRRTFTGVNWSRFGVAGFLLRSVTQKRRRFVCHDRAIGKDVSQRPAFLWALFPTLALFLSAPSISDAQVGRASLRRPAQAISAPPSLRAGNAYNITRVTDPAMAPTFFTASEISASCREYSQLSESWALPPPISLDGSPAAMCRTSLAQFRPPILAMPICI